jgi:hypothetical protein
MAQQLTSVPARLLHTESRVPVSRFPGLPERYLRKPNSPGHLRARDETFFLASHASAGHESSADHLKSLCFLAGRESGAHRGAEHDQPSSLHARAQWCGYLREQHTALALDYLISGDTAPGEFVPVAAASPEIAQQESGGVVKCCGRGRQKNWRVAISGSSATPHLV